MKLLTIIRLVLAFVLMTFGMTALASYPTLTGGSGTFSGSEICSGPGAPITTPDSGSFTIAFANQNDLGEFTVTISIDDGQVLTGGGSFTSPTTLQFAASGPNSDGNYDVVAFTNFAISGSSFSFDYSGAEFTDSTTSSPTGCSFSGTGSGTLTSAIVNPETASPNQILNNTNSLNQIVNTFVTTINTRIQNAFRGKRGFRPVANGVMVDTGKNAGDGSSNIAGVWGSWSHSTMENDFYRTAYDGDRDIFMGGVDFATTEDVIVGVSVAFEDADIDTDFNNGQASSDGYTIAPYVGVVIDDTWSFDVSGGFSSLETDQDRLDPFTNTVVTSGVDTDRLFASVNFNGFTQIDRWFLTGRIGALYAESEDDQFTESNGVVVGERKNKLGQFQLGGEAAYELGEWEPYIGGTYNYDMTSTDLELTSTGVAGDQPDNDHSDFLLSTGVRFYSKEGLTMSLGYDKRFGREDYDEETVTFSARWDF